MINQAQELVKDKSLELLPNKRNSYIGKSTLVDSTKSKNSLKLDNFANPYQTGLAPQTNTIDTSSFDAFLPSLVRNNQTVEMMAKYYDSSAQKGPRIAYSESIPYVQKKQKRNQSIKELKLGRFEDRKNMLTGHNVKNGARGTQKAMWVNSQNGLL